MKTFLKYTTAALVVGAVALAAASPSEARHGRNAAIIGFGAGALVGAAVASSANSSYYGPGYYDGGYAYEPAPVYVEPAPTYYERAPAYRSGGCWHVTDSTRGYGYYGAC
jgi:hypothetical protein